MTTDKIKILDVEQGRARALEEAEKFAAYEGYAHKDALRVRLLVEETLAMVSTIADDFFADFWIDGTRSGLCSIHLNIRTEMDVTKKKELIDASKEKRNEAARGLTGKIRELLENNLYLPRTQAMAGDSSDLLLLGMIDMPIAPGAPVPMDYVDWSLENYRQGIDDVKEGKPEAQEAWDELEKSILANLADDVRVAIRGNSAELVVEKKFTRHLA